MWEVTNDCSTECGTFRLLWRPYPCKVLFSQASNNNFPSVRTSRSPEIGAEMSQKNSTKVMRAVSTLKQVIPWTNTLRQRKGRAPSPYHVITWLQCDNVMRDDNDDTYMTPYSSPTQLEHGGRATSTLINRLVLGRARRSQDSLIICHDDDGRATHPFSRTA